MAVCKVRKERCKGCGLCVASCPKNLMKLNLLVNNNGYNTAYCVDQSLCIGCKNCEITCPDMAIEIIK